MSTQVFPTLIGQGWDIKRRNLWRTQIQGNVSGMETRTGFYSYPLYEWDLSFNVLRQGTFGLTAYTEFSQLFGFFNQMNGAFDSFLYEDKVDNAVTAQAVGTGDGVETDFQLVRAYGGFVEPIFAPKTISNVYIDGVNQPSGWSVANWGSANAGTLSFVTPPANTKPITVTYSYYFPCRFLEDMMEFNNFMNLLFEQGGVTIRSIKA